MTHWKLTLSYDGTTFHGWQVQPALVTIQGTLAQAIEKITGEPLLPQGSGRTDAGVHALAQVASFSIAASIPPPNFQRALNSLLPASIRVLAAEHAASDFHARYSAIGKSYEYRIFERRNPSQIQVQNGHLDRGIAASCDAQWRDPQSDRICPPFLAPYVWDCRWPVDIDRMTDATTRLIGEHDFASFAASDPDRSTREDTSAEPPSTLRTIHTSSWSRQADTLVYRVTGTGFLHHMVRNIVGTVVEVGRGALDPADIDRILAARDRSTAGPTAPACGLFLTAVEYPLSKAGL